MRLIEKCREFLDKNGHAGALLMDLSKAFDCLDHDLLIAKLHAYGFSRSALELIYSYLNERKQRVGKRIIQCMERINERCSAKFSLGTPSIQHIY